MPGKSRRQKDKRFHHVRKQTGPGQPVAVATQPAMAQTQGHLIQPGAPAILPDSFKPSAKISAAPYPYVNRELRTIILLAGMILVILIVVAFISR